MIIIPLVYFHYENSISPVCFQSKHSKDISIKASCNNVESSSVSIRDFYWYSTTEYQNCGIVRNIRNDLAVGDILEFEYKYTVNHYGAIFIGNATSNDPAVYIGGSGNSLLLNESGSSPKSIDAQQLVQGSYNKIKIRINSLTSITSIDNGTEYTLDNIACPFNVLNLYSNDNYIAIKNISIMR